MFSQYLNKSHSLNKFTNISYKNFSFWGHVKPRPSDPILGLLEEYRACSNPNKINLTAGTYMTNEGKPYILNCVKTVNYVLIMVSLGSAKTCRRSRYFKIRHGVPSYYWNTKFH